jgi:hypothetical protein
MQLLDATSSVFAQPHSCAGAHPVKQQMLCCCIQNCASLILLLHRMMKLAAEMRGQVGWQCSHPLRCFVCCAAAWLLAGMSEVT